MPVESRPQHKFAAATETRIYVSFNTYLLVCVEYLQCIYSEVNINTHISSGINSVHSYIVLEKYSVAVWMKWTNSIKNSVVRPVSIA